MCAKIPTSCFAHLFQFEHFMELNKFPNICGFNFDKLYISKKRCQQRKLVTYTTNKNVNLCHYLLRCS